MSRFLTYNIHHGRVGTFPRWKALLFTYLWKQDPRQRVQAHTQFYSQKSISSSDYPLQPARFLCPLNSPGKNTGVGCHSLRQGIFPTQGLNPVLLHCRQFLTISEPLGKILLEGVSLQKTALHKQNHIIFSRLLRIMSRSHINCNF